MIDNKPFAIRKRSRHWGTIPLSPEEAENQRSFALRPEVIMEGPGNGFRPTPPAR